MLAMVGGENSMLKSIWLGGNPTAAHLMKSGLRLLLDGFTSGWRAAVSRTICWEIIA
jgi:hypothetical protein